jgi:hypothetical protein
MVSSLSVYYRKLAYHVIESDGFLWVGFKPGMVHFIAKEVWNIRPLTRTDVERYYEEFTVLTQGKGSLYFRIVAHGGFLKEALAYELHGLTVSDDNYLRSLNSGRHVELYPHNEKAYRAIIKGFEPYTNAPTPLHDIQATVHFGHETGATVPSSFARPAPPTRQILFDLIVFDD